MGSDPPGSGVRLVPIPKAGGVRWLTRLDPVRAAAYAASVAPVVPAVERGLTSSVIANRVVAVTSDPPRIRLEAWRRARARFYGLASDLLRMAGTVVVADVRACYTGITGDRVGEALERLGVRPEEVGSVVGTMRRFEEDGVVGLPVGPAPSAVLANAVLAHADEALRAAGYRHLRWVDDLVVVGHERASAVTALQVLERALHRIGLELAAEKTRVLEAPSTLPRAAFTPSCCR